MQCSYTSHVVIVGGGLVGSSLALALAEDLSLQITLIDRAPAPQIIHPDDDFDPRAIALNLASKRLLQSLNVWNSIEQQRYCNYQKMHVWEFDGTGILDFSSELTEFAFEQTLGTIVENKVICGALWEQLQQNQYIRLLPEVDVEQVNASESTSGVLLQLSNGEVLQANLLCIADGGQSKLREQLKFPIRQFDCYQTAIACSVKLQQSHHNTAWQRFLPTGPVALLPLPAHSMMHNSEGHLCSVVWSMDNSHLLLDELSNSPNGSEVLAKALSQALDYRFGAIEILGNYYQFPLSQIQVTQYYINGAVLVGDSAHSIHPLAGQGGNIGLADVKVLAHVLAERKHLSVGDTRLLRRYQRQRQPANWAMGFSMDALRRIYGSHWQGLRLLRNTGINLINQSSLGKHLIRNYAMHG